MTWVDVTELITHLNLQGAINLDELSTHLDAACAAIEDIKGHINPVTVTVTDCPIRINTRHHYHGQPWKWVLELVETPILQVVSVMQGTTNIDTTGKLNDCLLTLPGPGEYTITYTAGVSEIPGNTHLAALELAAHLWRGSQLNQEGGRPQLGGDQEMIVPHTASAMPYRVRELLGLYGDVVNDHVVIA